MQLKPEFNIQPKYIRIAMLVMVVILSVLLILNAFRTREPAPNAPQTTDDTPQLSFLPLEDNTKIDFPGAKLQVPDGWTVTALLSDPQGTGYKCVGTECRVALVAPTNSSSKIVELVISTPTYVRLEGAAADLKKSNINVAFAGENILLSIDKIVSNKVTIAEDGTAKDEGVESEYIYQVYGCHSKDICIYATYFSDNPTVNSGQLQEIQDLLSRLSFI